MPKPKILIADPISDVGIDELRSDPNLEVDVRIGIKEADLLATAHTYNGIIVRSQTKITAAVFERARHLKAVGRAGVGVDNIDVSAATRHGVVVMNTPGGNTISTAEHAFTLLVALARHIPQAHASVVAGKWERRLFQGVELDGKTLSVIGMGRIGSELARRAMAFNMRVLAYDPYLTAQRAQTMRIELKEKLEDALAEADFITLHMPLTKETKGMINAERLERCKKGVRLVNCARGGLVDEEALVAALECGQVAGAAFDVFETEPPPPDHPFFAQEAKMVLTPHLGASTAEAQENVGIEVARQLRDFLLQGAVVNAVNMPNIDPKTMEQIGPFLAFAEKLGRVLSQLAPAQAEVLRVNYAGRIADLDTALISRAALKGFLEISSSEDSINFLNAPSVAEAKGLRFTESRLPGHTEFSDLIELNVGKDSGGAQADPFDAGERAIASPRVSVAGTFFGKEPRIVKMAGRRMEVVPEGHLLLLENKDMPGMVGAYGTLLGRHQVNIAHMSLSRDTKDGTALVVLNLDSIPSETVMADLRQVPHIISARMIQL
ncbi:MAG: phosphoglycerate dehydrogenase [Verrucomicrobiales bacterium]